MCGIVGILNKDKNKVVDKRLLEKMTMSISHRGPDDWGIYVNGNLGLGHRRLSILDLESGHQPMLDVPRKRAIVYNGEIYNYLDLRADLKKRGHYFSTNCDTEVLLKLADHHDNEYLEQLNGMFAFALWDENKRSLLLGRDRLGIKPLYYIDLGDVFLFSSEIKALLLYPNIRREANTDKIFEYIAYRNIVGTETMYKNIFQIPPGHVAKLNPDNYELKFENYWNEGKYNSYKEFKHDDDYIEQFLDIFHDAVKIRLISDVPVGTFNSGGVDSSLVSAIVRENKHDELHTFSAGFNEDTHDERQHALTVARQLGSTHHTIVMDEYEYSDSLEETLWYLEEPINHAHSVQILNLSRLSRNYVTVVLTGEGSDEIFAGYPRYNVPKLAYLTPNFLRGVISKLLLPFADTLKLRRAVKLFEAFGISDEELISDNARYVPLSALLRLVGHDITYPNRHLLYKSSMSRFNDNLQSHLYYDQRSYLSSLLTRLDKMSMAAGIEARVPFLDYRIIEWSYKIPSHIKLRLLTNKWIVKKAAENYLPHHIVYRNKVGFGAPISEWMRNPNGLGRYLDILTDQKAIERGYFNQKIIKDLLSEHLSGKFDHGEILWGLLNLELWHRNFIDEVKIH